MGRVNASDSHRPEAVANDEVYVRRYRPHSERRSLFSFVVQGEQSSPSAPRCAKGQVVKLKNEVRLNPRDALVTTSSGSDSAAFQTTPSTTFSSTRHLAETLCPSELNFLWEGWLGVFTNASPEAIVNKSQQKDFAAYARLMGRCFSEFRRVLKPGRWMTVEFHNSQNSVWNAIQQAIMESGFIIADVRVLDKKQGTFKQVTTAAAVKQDLVIQRPSRMPGLSSASSLRPARPKVFGTSCARICAGFLSSSKRMVAQR